MSVARNIIKNPKLVPGGGATELSVSATLKQKSSSIEGIEKILDAFNVKAQTFKTAIEAACMLLRIDDIVSGIKKKQAPGAGGPDKPTIEQEGDADNVQMIPE